MFPEDLKYSSDHEWVRVEGNVATVGISQYAVSELGDVVYVELPAAGREFKAGEEFGVVESVKTVSTLLCPVSGRVTEVNQKLGAQASLVNSDPYGEGWMIKVEMSSPDDLNQLLSSADYQSQLHG